MDDLPLHSVPRYPKNVLRKYAFNVPFSNESVACAASMFDKIPWSRMLECDVSDLSAPIKDAAESS